MPQDSITVLKELADMLVCGDRQERVHSAIAEIIRLRASIFRWIPVSERMPNSSDATENGDILISWKGFVFRQNWENTDGMTHWASIPPLPDRPQAEKDEELWQKCVLAKFPKNDQMKSDERRGFMAGLIAARAQKP